MSEVLISLSGRRDSFSRRRLRPAVRRLSERFFLTIFVIALALLPGSTGDQHRLGPRDGRTGPQCHRVAGTPHRGNVRSIAPRWRAQNDSEAHWAAAGF